jgi:hypothetical protein
MGMCRWCSIESKTFKLAVEGNSYGVWIIESCRGVLCFVFLGRTDCLWLLPTVEQHEVVEDLVTTIRSVCVF